MNEIKFPSYFPPAWSRCEEGPILPRGEEAYVPQPSEWGQSDLGPKKWSFSFSGSLLASKGTQVKGKTDIPPAGCNRCCLNFETGVWVLLLDFSGNGLEDFCGGANEENKFDSHGEKQSIYKSPPSHLTTLRNNQMLMIQIYYAGKLLHFKKKKKIALHFQNCRR